MTFLLPSSRRRKNSLRFAKPNDSPSQFQIETFLEMNTQNSFSMNSYVNKILHDSALNAFVSTEMLGCKN